MKNLDHIINPLELVELVIFTGVKFDLHSHNQYLQYKFRPIESIMLYELEIPSDTTLASLDSDTRLKLMLANHINEFNYNYAYSIISALGWGDWPLASLTGRCEIMNINGWWAYYAHLRALAIHQNFIDGEDYCEPEDLNMIINNLIDNNL